MKRYKLLKDLAGLEAGSTLYLNELGNLVAEDKTTIVFLANFIHYYNILDSDWFEELPEGYKRCRAYKGDLYWYVSSYSEARNATYSSMELYCSTDDYRYSIGNYFKTKAEARKAVNWLKAVATLRDDTKGFKPDWEDSNQNKWHVLYNHVGKELDCNCARVFQAELLYFATREDAEKSIKAHERQWLTFFNCGVEE